MYLPLSHLFIRDSVVGATKRQRPGRYRGGLRTVRSGAVRWYCGLRRQS